MAFLEDNSLSMGSPLLRILRMKPRLIDQLASLLDRETKSNWMHLAKSLDVDAKVVTCLKDHTIDSPTIQMFKFLKVMYPDWTIRQLRDLILRRKRPDILHLLAVYEDSTKVKDVITAHSGLQAKLALALDGKSPRLGVPKCLNQNPTKELFWHLATTRPQLTVKELKETLSIIGRRDVLDVLQTHGLKDSLSIIHLVVTRSEILDRITEALNPERVPGVKNWRYLAHRLGIPSNVFLHWFNELEGGDPSPTKEVFMWLALRSPSTNLGDVLVALEIIERHDAIGIITDAVDAMPSYVVARGPKAMSAYLRAKASGKTLDRRVKVVLIGQDRVGKTSVGRSLKGEQFRANETSTDGVQMHEPVRNPGVRPWKDFLLQKGTTAYHHKFAECVNRELLAEKMQVEEDPTEKVPNTFVFLQRSFPGFSKRPDPASPLTYELTSPYRVKTDEFQPSNSHLPWFPSPREKEDDGDDDGEDDDDGGGDYHGDEHANDDIRPDSKIPNKIFQLNDEEVGVGEANGIWPVIWDFAGQAVYRAIHPIFMSSEALYVLVFDLTKDIHAMAKCRVSADGLGEIEIEAPDCLDTNLDHILRLLDLVHSLRQSENDYKFPPVVLVGTHADEVCNPNGKMDHLNKFLMHNAPDFFKRIAKRLTIDNKLAGQLAITGEEDPRIIALRQTILNVGDAMPHTKLEVPLKWLEVENMICSHLSAKKETYMTKQKFKMEIVDKVVQGDFQDDLEHLLNFLHDRGTVVYHDCAGNPDGLVVLDPQWLTHDVLCKIITVKEQSEDEAAIILFRKELKDKGVLHPELLDHACRNLALGDIKHSLIYIMKKFNLLCECKDKIGKSLYLVPCMLTTKPVEDLMGPVFQGCAPVYITFDTNYVPAGLFSRLLVFFGEWTASKTSCEQLQLFANAARFFIGEVTCLSFACSKTVIKIHMWTMDGSNPAEREPEVSSEASRILRDSLEKLKGECHWLCAVSWQLCGQCKLCPGKVDPETRKCFWHQVHECLHDDCAHYVPVDSLPFCCKDAKGPDLRIPQTWIQALKEDALSNGRSARKTCNGGVVEPSVDQLPVKVSWTARCAVKEGIPSEEELEELSVKIAEAWKPLGRRLKIHEAKLIAFHKENEEYSEKAYKMLLHWREREGPAATYQVLYDALCHKLVNKRLLADEFCCN